MMPPNHHYPCHCHHHHHLEKCCRPPPINATTNTKTIIIQRRTQVWAPAYRQHQLEQSESRLHVSHPFTPTITNISTHHQQPLVTP
jgi:hypothetical protein